MKETMTSGSQLDQSRDVGDVDYLVQSDTDETSSIVVTSTIFSVGSEGETPQQMCVIEDRGGGSIGETTVRSRRSVKVVTVVSGADAITGVTGV